jgi:integrase
MRVGAGERGRDLADPPAFENARGSKYHPHSLRREWAPAVREAGIKDFRWNDLRHTFASRLAMQGVELRTVAELMGHKTIQMTMRYAHLSPGFLADAVRKLDAPSSGARKRAAKAGSGS